MTLALVPLLPVLACGPFFPVSYFPHDEGGEAGKPCYSYRVTPHLGQSWR